MRSTANTVLEHTLGQGVVRKRKRVVRKTKVVRGKEKVVRGAARVVRAPPPRVARDLIFVEIPRHMYQYTRLLQQSAPSLPYSFRHELNRSHSLSAPAS